LSTFLDPFKSLSFDLSLKLNRGLGVKLGYSIAYANLELGWFSSPVLLALTSSLDNGLEV